MGRQNGLMIDHWAVTSHVGRSPFCASNVQALALTFFFGNCSVSAWFALTRATFLSTRGEDFPVSPREMLPLSHWV